MTDPDPFALAGLAAAGLARASGRPRHDVLVVGGTGLAGLGPALLPHGTDVDLEELAGFPHFSVLDHRAIGRSGTLDGQRLLVVAGRAHLYEGHRPEVVVHTVRTAIAAGVGTVILTSSVGSLRPEIGPGRIVLVSDHLNLTGRSALHGVGRWATGSDDHSGPVDPGPVADAVGGKSGPPGRTAVPGVPGPFVDLVDAWSPRLRAIVLELDPSLPEGVYAHMPGPQFETPAEIRMLAAMGADVVGMSATLEAVAARHLGADVLGLAVVSNLAAGLSGTGLDPHDIAETGRSTLPRLEAIIRHTVSRL